MRKIKWLTKSVIKRRSKTLRGAILVSIEHHQQIADATMLEFFTAVAKHKVAISSPFCGMCINACGKKDCHPSCFLYSYNSHITHCCPEWSSIRTAIDLVFVDSGTWEAVQKAERKMIMRLKRELKKVS